MLGLGAKVGSEACTFAPSGEDVVLERDEEDTENGKAEDPPTTGGELSASAGLEGGAVEQASPDTVNVESSRIVTTPLLPVAVNADWPFTTPELGAAVITGAEDDGVAIPPKLKLCEELADVAVDVAEEEGTIPPMLDVLEEDEKPNWRLFSLMTDGEGAGALRTITEGLPGPCGPAASPAAEL